MREMLKQTNTMEIEQQLEQEIVKGITEVQEAAS